MVATPDRRPGTGRRSVPDRPTLRPVFPKVNLFAALVLFAAAAAAPAGAEVVPSVKLTLLNSLYRTDGGGAELIGAGTARLGLDSRGNPSVRAGLVLDVARTFYHPGPAGAEPPETGAAFDVSRAWVRARFPVGDEYTFRITAGKTRLSWGYGAFFNAGDVIFGSSTASADFLGDALRDETRWLLSAYFPLGAFAFFEPLVLPPDYSLASPAPAAADAKNTAAGGRLQAKWLGTVWEAGYLYKGTEELHHPYVSLQGHFLVDGYAAASSRIPAFEAETADLRRSLEISFGLLHIADSPEHGTLTLRLEGLLRPGGVWKDPGGGESVGDFEAAGYGLFLFPEISWSPTRTLAWTLRSVLSPVDRSAFFSGGVTWKPYQGFSLLFFVGGMAGQEGDLFGWDRAGGIGCTTGIIFNY